MGPITFSSNLPLDEESLESKMNLKFVEHLRKLIKKKNSCKNSETSPKTIEG